MLIQGSVKTLVLGLIAVAGLSGCALSDDQREATVEQNVLTAPTGVTAVSNGTDRINVSWTAVTGATLYYVYRSDSGGPFNGIAAVAAPMTTFKSANLQPGTTYAYKITAYDPADGESPQSTAASATTDGTQGFGPPTGVTATATSSSRITVAWNSVPTATLYYIYESVNGGTYNAVAASSTTTTDRAGLTAATSYCYEISAYSGGVFTALSAPACATTFDVNGGLTAPTNVTASAVSDTRIAVAWSSVTNATLYYIYRSDNGGTFNAIASSSTTNFDSAGLTTQVNYCYEIQAYNAAGSSPLSAPACATTLTQGLDAQWKFDDKTGTTAIDSSGNNRNGSLAGAAAFTTADVAPLMDENKKNSSSLSIPGGAADLVSVPAFAATTFADPFSVSMWINPTSTGTFHFFGKRADACGAVDVEIGQDGGGLYLQGSTTLSFGQTLAANTWTEVAVSYSSGTATLFVNGAQVATGAFALGTYTNTPLQIGNSGGCGSSGAYLVDETRVYSSALSATEVAALGTRPPAPATLSATVMSSTEIVLNWSAVPNATRYIIYRGTASGNETFLTTTGAVLTYDEGHFTPGQTGFWYVRSVVNGLISPNSTEVTATTNGAPAAPTGVTATATSSTQIQVSWSAVSTATVYYIYMSTNGGAYTAVGAVTSPTLTFDASNLTANTNYSFEVTDIDSGGTESAMSAPASATTLP